MSGSWGLWYFLAGMVLFQGSSLEQQCNLSSLSACRYQESTQRASAEFATLSLEVFTVAALAGKTWVMQRYTRQENLNFGALTIGIWFGGLVLP